jgi:hypothetical protein
MLLARHYSTLTLEVDEQERRARITGRLEVVAGCGTSRGEVALEFVYPPDYPASPPRVREMEGRFPHDIERHIVKDGWFCLQLPETRELDLAATHTIVDFVDQVVVFLDRQFVYESMGGKWPGPAWGHGYAAHAEYLQQELGVETGRLRALLSSLLARAPGRNDTCPCGSGSKFKRCHLGAVQQLRLRHGIAEFDALRGKALAAVTQAEVIVDPAGTKQDMVGPTST